MKRTLVLPVTLAFLICPDVVSTQETPEPDTSRILPQPLPAKPIPPHDAGKPSNAASYVTQVTRLNDEEVEETAQLSGLEAMVADGYDLLATLFIGEGGLLPSLFTIGEAGCTH